MTLKVSAFRRFYLKEAGLESHIPLEQVQVTENLNARLRVYEGILRKQWEYKCSISAEKPTFEEWVSEQVSRETR